MRPVCLVCLGNSDDPDAHPECLQTLFGVRRCPVVRTGDRSIGEEIAEQSGRISISGIQQKLLVDLSDDRSSLQPDPHGRYILKPPTSGFKRLPENEHLSMQLARLVGLDVPDNGLVRISRNELAYVVKRFDRTDDRPPRKLRQEDFCSLAGRDPTDKYRGSAEECADLVRRYSADPEKSLRRLFLLFLYSYWISNEDLHLKNLALLEDPNGRMILSPAYDLLSTRIYQHLKHAEALPLNGKKEQLSRADFIAFGRSCELPAEESQSIIDQVLSRQKDAESLVNRSAMTVDGKKQYVRWMKRKAKALSSRPPRR